MNLPITPFFGNSTSVPNGLLSGDLWSEICGQTGDLWSDGTGTLGKQGLIMDRTRVHLVFAGNSHNNPPRRIGIDLKP